jgi:hypothetical protein
VLVIVLGATLRAAKRLQKQRVTEVQLRAGHQIRFGKVEASFETKMVSGAQPPQLAAAAVALAAFLVSLIALVLMKAPAF